MKKNILLLLLACVVLGLKSCYNVDGYCDDPPRFSSTSLNFDAKGGSGAISSPNVGWWGVGGITVDSCLYNSLYQCGPTGEGDCRLTVYCDSFYNPDDYYRQGGFTLMLKVEGTWFSMVEEQNVNLPLQRLQVSVQPNETGKSRKVRVRINAGNCGVPDLIVTQSAE